MSDKNERQTGKSDTAEIAGQLKSFIERTVLSMDGFTRNIKDGVRAKDPKRGLVSLAKEFAISKMHLGQVVKDVEEIKGLANSLKQSFAMLSRNDVLIQTITANVVYEFLGRQDEWNESFATFQTMKLADENTPGAVGIRVSLDSRIEYIAQERRASPDDEITYRVIPTQFLDGIKFHSVQAFMRKRDLKIDPGSAIYFTFEGSEDFVDLIPEDYIDVDKRIDAAAEEVNEWADEYEKDGGAQSVSRVAAGADGEIENIAKEIFPDGVDEDGEPVDMDLMNTAVSGVHLEGTTPETEDVAKKINEANNGE